MNANELADELNQCIKDGSTDLVCVEQAATMLRQQESNNQLLNDTITVCEEHIERLKAEIEALQAENERLFASMLTMALDEEVRKANEK
jgi:predicted RNase H-like nuclease (RuvC/YqgF family)